MDLRKYFQYTLDIDLTAAHIGINKWEWISADTDNLDEAREIMMRYRFDVLPIIGRDGIVNSYFSTRVWNNYEYLDRKNIDDSSLLYYRTNFSDLIRKFTKDKRRFFFLTNHNEVVGMVSQINLNSQPVYSYIFQLISNLEILISQAFQNQFDIDYIHNVLKNSSDERCNKIAQNFEINVANGVDESIYSLFYLDTFGILLKKLKSDFKDPLDRLPNYQKKFLRDYLYTNIRNAVMHPVNPILSEKIAVSDLDEFLNDYHEISTILK